MTCELNTQEELDAFADEVARELGTHCRTAELTDYGRGLGRLIVDGEGRDLRLCQPDDRRPDRLQIHAALTRPRCSHRRSGSPPAALTT